MGGFWGGGITWNYRTSCDYRRVNRGWGVSDMMRNSPVPFAMGCKAASGTMLSKSSFSSSVKRKKSESERKKSKKQPQRQQKSPPDEFNSLHDTSAISLMHAAPDGGPEPQVGRT